MASGGSGLSVLDELPFDFRGVGYRTAQNAFQAQKAPPSEREKFANVPANEATRLGRACTINVAEWDANRVALMTEIITEQAMQQDGMRRALEASGCPRSSFRALTCEVGQGKSLLSEPRRCIL